MKIFDKFKQELNGFDMDVTLYNDAIDRGEFSITDELLNFFYKPKNLKKLISFFNNEKETQLKLYFNKKNIYGQKETNIPKRDFIYKMEEYLNKNPKALSKENLEKYRELKKIFEREFEIHPEKNPKYLNETILNENLKNNILKSIPSNFNDLEKAFYIYFELCNIFTYDEEQFLSDEFDFYTIDHWQISRIKELDESNNKIMCFEIIVLYAKFLDELGIEYEIKGCNLEKYGNGHISLKLKVNDMYISADPTRLGIIPSDMSNAKRNSELNFFYLINDYETNLELFDNSIDKVYNYYRKKKNKNIMNYNDALAIYKKVYKRKNLSIENKLEIFFDKIKKCRLPETDKLRYFQILTSTIFTEETGNNKTYLMDVYFAKDNRFIDNNGNNIKIISIFILKVNNEKRYFISDYKNQITEIDLNKLNNMFNNKSFEINPKEDKNIPGIKI